MEEICFTWFDNVKNGRAILHIFKTIAASSCKSHEFVANAAKTILAVIRNVEILKDSNTDFLVLGRDAAVLAAAVYRLHTQRPHISRPQLDEQMHIMVEILKSVEDFTVSCVGRSVIRRAVSKQTDRKMIEKHQKRIADILANVEFTLLPRSAPPHYRQHLNQDVLDIAEKTLLEQYENTESGVSLQKAAPNGEDMPETENEQLDQLSVEDSGAKVHTTTRRTSWKESGTGNRDQTPSPVHYNADDVHFLSQHHVLPSKHLPGYAHLPHCPFHPQQAAVRVSGMTAPSLTPSTIIYDYSRHTTHHGSHNYQGQNVNQSPSAHGLAPARVPPQNIYMKHFNGNEIHCWTPSTDTHGYYFTRPGGHPAYPRPHTPHSLYNVTWSGELDDSGPSVGSGGANLDASIDHKRFFNDDDDSYILCPSPHEPSSGRASPSRHSTG